MADVSIPERPAWCNEEEDEEEEVGSGSKHEDEKYKMRSAGFVSSKWGGLDGTKSII